MKNLPVVFAALLQLAQPGTAAFIYLDEFQQKASPPQYKPTIEFEICVPKQLPNIVLQDGTDKGDLWCHQYTGWIRMKNDPGGWLDISGLQLGFSTKSWTVWDYAAACVIALRESDINRLKAMSEDAAQANFEKMVADASPASVPKILQQASSLRALCHIRKDNIEWLFLEIYFIDRIPSMLALSLRKKNAYSHQFIDAKIQEHPAILNAFVYFSYELSRAAHQAMENAQNDIQFGKNFTAPEIGAVLRQPLENSQQTPEKNPTPTSEP